MELTEALSHLPAGGQVLLSDTTSRLTAGRLHRIHLPAFTFQCSRRSLEETKSARTSLEGLRSVYTHHLVSITCSAVRCTQGIATETAAMQAVYVAGIAGFCPMSQAAENENELLPSLTFGSCILHYMLSQPKPGLIVTACKNKHADIPGNFLMHIDCQPPTGMLCYKAW